MSKLFFQRKDMEDKVFFSYFWFHSGISARFEDTCSSSSLSKLRLACQNIRFSSLFVAWDVSRGGTSATQWQKFHTDDANQCLHNKSGSHGVPNTNLFNFTCLLVDFGKFLCSSANKLQQNSNTSSREEYTLQILTVLLEILRVYI